MPPFSEVGECGQLASKFDCRSRATGPASWTCSATTSRATTSGSRRTRAQTSQREPGRRTSSVAHAPHDVTVEDHRGVAQVLVGGLGEHRPRRVAGERQERTSWSSRQVYSTLADAHRRFDEMLERSVELAFAKQPVIERTTQLIVGYSGVNVFEFEGQQRLEYGYRFVPDARGRGYSTEAGRALLGVAEESFCGEILAMIDPRNVASQNVARKLGFAFWKQAVVDGFLDNLYRRQVRQPDHEPE